MKNATLDASAAARTAENEPEEVYLRFPKGKAVPFENARECTSGRHVGAFAWVNMHQIMRDILRGALMESLILENASFVEKMNILLFENAWKGAWWAKKQFSNTESFQKCPPLRRGSVTHEDFLMLRVLMRLLIVNMNKLDLIRFLFLSKKKIFCQFSRFAVVV